MPNGLTEKQRRFVEAYTGAAEGNATEAARMAGYSGDGGTLAVTATRTLRVAKVAEAIAEATEPVRSAAIMDRKERQELLTTIARGGDPEAKPSDRLRAIEVLGKMQGDFIERSEQRVTTNIDPRLANLTTQQLLDLLSDDDHHAHH